MAKFIDIQDRESLNEILFSIQPGAMPAWGRLDAQSMVEHLSEAVSYTNGKNSAVLDVSAEVAEKGKRICVTPEFVIPRGAPGFLEDATIKKRYKDLRAAIAALNSEINVFELYYEVQGRTAIHPAFGALDYRDWLLWHGKHFAHHFLQFGLI